MQHDAPHGGLDPGTELDEPLAQGTHLSAGAGGSRGVQSQLLHQDVGGRRQQHAQLVRSISSPWCSFPGRDAPCGAPPGQIRASPIQAHGSHLGCLTAKRRSGQG